jgi:hypothetical protein
MSRGLTTVVTSAASLLSFHFFHSNVLAKKSFFHHESSVQFIETGQKPVKHERRIRPLE